MPSLWNPTTMATAAQFAHSMTASNGNGTNNNGANEAIYKMGLQMGHTFLDQGTARLIPGLETFMRTLRVYFAVDNGFVKRKMCRVLFSFFCKSWSRIVSLVIYFAFFLFHYFLKCYIFFSLFYYSCTSYY